MVCGSDLNWLKQPWCGTRKAEAKSSRNPTLKAPAVEAEREGDPAQGKGQEAQRAGNWDSE